MKFFATLILFLVLVSPSVAQTEIPNQPLSVQNLNMMLRRNVGRDMTEADVIARIQRIGIDFEPTPEIMARFRFNGAHPSLLNAIRREGIKVMNDTNGKVTSIVSVSDPIIEEVRKKVKDYVDELPDFICSQEVERFYDTDGSGSWQRGDNLVFELTYNGKRESYKMIRVNGMPGEKLEKFVGGASSSGEFASMLASLFAASTQAEFIPAGKEKLGTHQALIYDFHVKQSNSSWRVSLNSEPAFIAAYSGTVWIDAESKYVLRIEQAVEDPPAPYRTFSGDSVLDYELVKIKGLETEVLLPVKAELTLLTRAQKSYARNVIRFKFYRKFESDVKVILEDEGAKPDPKPEKPPQK